MDSIFNGDHSYNVYFGNGSNACTIRANSEYEAAEKFKTLVDAGKRGEPIVKIVKII